MIINRHWHLFEDVKPADGQTVVLCFSNGEVDKQFWTTDLATYCDGTFYKLEYDEHLGVLRKVPVHEKVLAWSSYLTYSLSDEWTF